MTQLLKQKQKIHRIYSNYWFLIKKVTDICSFRAVYFRKKNLLWLDPSKSKQDLKTFAHTCELFVRAIRNQFSREGQRVLSPTSKEIFNRGNRILAILYFKTCCSSFLWPKKRTKNGETGKLFHEEVLEIQNKSHFLVSRRQMVRVGNWVTYSCTLHDALGPLATVPEAGLLLPSSFSSRWPSWGCCAVETEVYKNST